MTLRHTFSIAILGIVPISIVANRLHWESLFVFSTSVLAIIALSLWIARATEKVAAVMGPSMGGLVNAIFSNVTELVIALVALKEGLIDLVKAIITGSILCDLLLFIGLGMLAGGLRYKEQEFKSIFAKVNGSSMTLAVVAVSLPTMVIYTSNIIEPVAIRNLSVVVAILLIFVYGLTLLFSLKTHSYLYDVSVTKEEEVGAEQNLIDTESEQVSSLGLWVCILLVATVAVAYESELFIGEVESVTSQLGLTALFTGVILVPVISDIAGLITVTKLALKDEMNLMVSVAMGDSLLVALFLVPTLVLVGLVVHQPMNLNFNPFQILAWVIAVTIINLICLGGRSNWLDGILLLSTYIILGVSFYYHPA